MADMGLKFVIQEDKNEFRYVDYHDNRLFGRISFFVLSCGFASHSVGMEDIPQGYKRNIFV